MMSDKKDLVELLRKAHGYRMLNIHIPYFTMESDPLEVEYEVRRAEMELFKCMKEEEEKLREKKRKEKIEDAMKIMLGAVNLLSTKTVSSSNKEPKEEK